jgi:pimeloyl-ACP methyl ester carboxylesterase
VKTLLVAIHGIMTNQTNASWPDKLDAWMFDRDPEIKVIKKEYRAGPFPRWNCRVKDPALARSLANEIDLFLERPFFDPTPRPALWFVAHSNGAIIALLTAKLLAQRGLKIGGLILTGAACEADIAKNGILELIGRGALGAIMAYCSRDDKVLAGDPDHSINHEPSTINWFRQRVWGWLMKPYGCLGRTGLLLDGRRLVGLDTIEHRPRVISTRYFRGGHSTYFTDWNITQTFDQIHNDITRVNALLYDHRPNSRPSDWRN